jgi:hypothetical protein
MRISASRFSNMPGGGAFVFPTVAPVTDFVDKSKFRVCADTDSPAVKRLGIGNVKLGKHGFYRDLFFRIDCGKRTDGFLSACKATLPTCFCGNLLAGAVDADLYCEQFVVAVKCQLFFWADYPVCADAEAYLGIFVERQNRTVFTVQRRFSAG